MNTKATQNNFLLPPLSSPHFRPRRLRLNPAIREMVAETRLHPSNFLVPLFVSEKGTQRFHIPSLPGVSRVPLQDLATEVKELYALGAKGVVLFPVNSMDVKSHCGKEAYNPNGLVQRAIQECKNSVAELAVFADVALDPFTTHGHDGITKGNTAEGEVLNDETIEALCKMSVTLAAAGVDFVAPSDMMDGRIGAIRTELDMHGHWRVGILAYSAKFASCFYGPFREAVNSGARGLDKKTYQLSAGNRHQAIREVALDTQEGADMLMIKPALPYLDIIREVKQTTNLPVVSYQVSGEYAMIKAAAERGWIDEHNAVVESLTSIKRAGSDIIVSYFAPWCLKNLF